MNITELLKGLPEQRRQQAIARIEQHTYPDTARIAVELYQKLTEKIARITEPFDFGETAIDIGSRDGRYMHVIRELGLTQITAVDPSENELQTGINAGYIPPENAFFGTLEAYVATHPQQVDTVFAFNVAPILSRNDSFINALLQSVRPGGILVISAIELATYRNICARICWQGKADPLRKKVDKEAIKNEIFTGIDYGGEPNHFIAIERRRR